VGREAAKEQQQQQQQQQQEFLVVCPVMDHTLREFPKIPQFLISSSAAAEKADRKAKIERWDRQREEERKRGEEARKEWEKKHGQLPVLDKKN